MTDPICGNCGNALSKHFREKYGEEERIYCNTRTNGDVFTDEPADHEIMCMLIDRIPDVYDTLVATWKREHGHAT